MGIELDRTAGSVASHPAWQRDGAVMIRRFLLPEDVARLAALVDATYDAVLRAVDCGAALDPNITLNLEWAGIPHQELPDFLSRFAPALGPQWRDLSGAVEAQVASLFGTRWRPVPARSFFRRIDGGQHQGVPWHIDADAAAMIGAGRDSFNVWLPLAEVGSDAPSLEFVLGSHHYMRRIPIITEGGRLREDEWVRANIVGDRWTPKAAPGDAVIFGQHVLHRTQPGPATPRASCEFRFVLRHPLPRRIASRLKYSLFSPADS
jgi:hypothetical protein